MMQYLQDNDEKYPPANKWCNVLQPYLKEEQTYHCPVAGEKNYGYAMNWKLSRQSMAAIHSPADTNLFYESNVLQRNRNGDGKDLEFRHEREKLMGANYAYTDGHVQWNRQANAQNFRLNYDPAAKAPLDKLPSPKGAALSLDKK